MIVERWKYQKAHGSHCLNLWNDYHPRLVRNVKKDLLDPSSFEHIDTTLKELPRGEATQISMRYRRAMPSRHGHSDGGGKL